MINKFNVIMTKDKLETLNELKNRIEDYERALKKLALNGSNREHGIHDYQFGLFWENPVSFNYESSIVFVDDELTKAFTEMLKKRIKELKSQFNEL